jgi:hypothetical protein
VRKSGLTSVVHEIGREVALGMASALSVGQSVEMWRIMQLVACGGSTDGLPGSLLQLAVMFNSYPEVRKLISEAALGYAQE